MFNYVIFYNLTLASQVQFLFALMHILNNSWYVIENAQVCYSVHFVRYRGNAVMRKQVPLC